MNESYVVCMICEKKIKVINHLHLKSHSITTKEYVKKFPNVELSSKSTIEKRRKKLKGQKRDIETRKKISEAVKLNWGKNPNQGRTGHSLSEKSKKALSKKMMGHEVSDETRKKISEGGMGRIPWNKGLTKYDDERIMGISKKVIEWIKKGGRS